MKTTLLAIAALGDAATGLLLPTCPPIGVRPLFGAEVAGAGIGMCRIAGIAVLALGICCWPGKGQAGALLGTTTYSALATSYLASPASAVSGWGDCCGRRLVSMPC